MNAKVTMTKYLNLDEIQIGEYTLSDILDLIHKETTECLQNISIERQKDIQDFTDIDSPLHYVLNLIEEVRGY